MDALKASNYLSQVAVPMDLTTIMLRLVYGFYRHIEALTSDVDLLRHNCHTYNQRHSEIWVRADAMHAKVMAVINAARSGTNITSALAAFAAPSSASAPVALLAGGAAASSSSSSSATSAADSSVDMSFAAAAVVAEGAAAGPDSGSVWAANYESKLRIKLSVPHGRFAAMVGHQQKGWHPTDAGDNGADADSAGPASGAAGSRTPAATVATADHSVEADDGPVFLRLRKPPASASASSAASAQPARRSHKRVIDSDDDDEDDGDEDEGDEEEDDDSGHAAASRPAKRARTSASASAGASLAAISASFEPAARKTRAQIQAEEAAAKEAQHQACKSIMASLLKLTQRNGLLSWFAYPVTDDDAPGYSDVITDPMDLQTLNTIVSRRTVTTLQQLAVHLTQIWHNAMIFNPPGSKVAEAAEEGLQRAVALLSEAATKLGLAGNEDDKLPPLPNGSEPRPAYHLADDA